MSLPHSAPSNLTLARALAVSIGITAALAVGLGVVLTRGGPAAPLGNDVLTDSASRDQAIAGFVQGSGGAWDGHPDPDVGRVLQPGLEGRKVGAITIDSNRFGLRERDFEVPKPPGTLRLIALGDSYVFGNGVAAGDRFGVHLEQWLNDAAPEGTTVEVLHVGQPDWNQIAESNYLRRSLELYQPDAVVHVLIYNDLDDSPAARGFGMPASWSSQRRRAAEGMLASRHPAFLGFSSSRLGGSMLHAALDWESRTRYRAAGTAIAALRAELGARGVPYRALLYWPGNTPFAERALLGDVPAKHKTYLPSSVLAEKRLQVSANDVHWNPEGHERVAELIHALLVRAGGLNGLELAPRAAHEAVTNKWHEVGRLEAQREGAPVDFLEPDAVVVPSIDFSDLNRHAAAQVHGGVFAEGRSAPYASLCLKNDQASAVEISMRGLGTASQIDSVVRIFVDEFEVGQFEQRERRSTDLRFALPAEVSEREVLSIRFEASDWIYEGSDGRLCTAFFLERVALAG
ncbi:MAG: SGNH/GDSL hydrolase family protein [Planctomycetota bacterium]